jgi:hypothetical protein
MRGVGKETRLRQYYWRCECSFLEYAKQIEWETDLFLLAKICNASPIRETMPIYKSVASGNGKKEFYKETTCSNLKQPSIAIIPD